MENDDIVIEMVKDTLSNQFETEECLEEELAPLDIEIDEPEVKELIQEELEQVSEESQLDEVQEDMFWRARTGLDEDSLCGAIETIIFMSEKPISLTKIRNMIDRDLPLRLIHSSVEKLQADYEKSIHGIRLMEVAEGYQFRTKALYSKYVHDLLKVSSLVLSPTALEVLAIIAYKQPISRIEIDKIRGVDSSHIVRILMDKRLVKIAGRSDEMGRPVVYGTTSEFLEVFNLSDITQLPPEHELDLMAESDVGKISDIKSICASDDKNRFFYDEIDELDKLSQNIKSVTVGTKFTKSLQCEEKKRVDEEGTVKKTAFEILEEYVERSQIAKQNELAGQSDLIMHAINPVVVKDLDDGPFNTPSTEEDDQFEMIDLDTGEKISTVEPSSISHSLDMAEKESMDDEQNLNLAIDKAFENLTMDSKLEEEEISIDDSDIDELEEKVSDLDNISKKMMTKGSELDLDLNLELSD